MHTSIFKYYKNLPITINKMVVAALGISLFFILQSFTEHLINQYNYTFSWLLVSLNITITYLFWVLLSPFIYQLTKVLQKKQNTIGPKILQFLAGAILLAIMHQLITSRFDDFINYLNTGYMKSFFGRNNIVILTIGSFSSLIELLVIVAIFFASDYQKRYLQNQKALIAAQLNALRMQLQPHFLFNTLHSIAAMIDIDTQNAQKMLTKLGSLLRSMLEYNDQQMVTVEDELDFIKNYLDLEQVRYQDRVTINYTISKDALSLKIPNMIFQPLVENAVKHGIIPTIDDGEITIDIQLEHSDTLNEEALVLQISNTFNSNSLQNKPVGTGVGLTNTKKRLQQFYQDNFLFTSRFLTSELYIAKIIIPIIK